MSSSRPRESVAYDHPRSVPIAELEKELRGLWHVTQDEGARAGATVTRACMLNVAVYCTTDGAVQEARQTIPELMREHPCRALIIRATPDYSLDRDGPPVEDTKLEARIATFCHLAGPSRQVCCEQIIIKAEGRVVQALPGVMTPLFVPELPTVLWWRAARALPALPRRLFSLFDGLIIDSHDWTQPDQDLQRVAQLACRPTHRPRVLDLAWTRTALWREAIAQLFDAPEALQRLPDIQRIRIEAGSRGSGMLLAGWLKSRLPPVRTRPDTAASPELPAVQIIERPGEPEIVACHLETAPDAAACFSVEDHGALTLTTALPDQPQQKRTLAHRQLALGPALCGALETLRGDPLLESALQAIATPAAD